MRVLHLSDTHLGAWLAVRGAPQGWQRAADHQHAMERALQPALRGEVDLVVHTGDLYDRSSPPARWVQAACETLRRAARRVPVVVLRGNHDRRGISSSLPRGLPDLHVIDEAVCLRVAGLRLAVVPYLRSAEAWRVVAGRACAGGVDALLCHQAFHGVCVPGFQFTVGRQADTVGEAHLPPGVRHVLCGHIHPRQIVRVGAAIVVHPGSTARTAGREGPESKGVARWRFGRRVEVSFEDLPDRPWLHVRRGADLSRVVPGALVRVAPGELEHEVRQLGGWLLGRGGRRPSGRHAGSAKRPAQLRLF